MLTMPGGRSFLPKEHRAQRPPRQRGRQQSRSEQTPERHPLRPDRSI